MTRSRSFSWLMLIALAGLLIGCLDQPGTDSDAAPTPDVDVTIDGAVEDATVHPDAAVVCDPDDLVEQLTCGSGRKCTLVDSLYTVGCADSGFTTAYSACDGSTRPDGCAIGTLCSDVKESGIFLCLPFCEGPAFSCDGGRCRFQLDLPGSREAYLCEPEDGCEPVAAQTGVDCPALEACYLTREGGGLTFCEPAGLLSLGESCAGEFSCEPGLACFGPIGQSGTCVQLCHRDNDADCTTGGLCGPVTESFGICQ
ncbi:MAG: hypothetical protein ABI333_23555 [bacterium]